MWGGGNEEHNYFDRANLRGAACSCICCGGLVGIPTDWSTVAARSNLTDANARKPIFKAMRIVSAWLICIDSEAALICAINGGGSLIDVGFIMGWG